MRQEYTIREVVMIAAMVGDNLTPSFRVETLDSKRITTTLSGAKRIASRNQKQRRSHLFIIDHDGIPVTSRAPGAGWVTIPAEDSA